jgi:hypothetical protein
MGRLLVFLASVTACLAAVAAVNWWYDPFGLYFKPDILGAADRTHCLVADDAIGSQSYPQYKAALSDRRGTTVAVVGSSRVLKIASHPAERSFTNLGFPDSQAVALDAMLRRIHPKRLTLYYGVDSFWFNRSWDRVDFDPPLVERIKYLVNRADLKLSIQTARSFGGERWGRYTIGSACALGRSATPVVWAQDGSRIYSFEIEPGGKKPPATPFVSDVRTLRSGIYLNWTALDPDQLKALDRTLTFAQHKGWNVVGFSPPDSTRYAKLLARAPETAAMIAQFSKVIPALFHSHGFKWLDIHDVRLVPCAQDAFVDDGYHPDAACARKIRARLDAAAGATR